jgi:lambda family phage portal protein
MIPAAPWNERGPPGIKRASAGGASASTAVAVAEVETAHHAASWHAKDMATWGGMRLSPDAALLPELDTISARIDDLARNNGVASGSERTFIDNVIGPRVTCKPNPDRVAIGRSAEWVAEWSPIVESLWSSFFDTDWFDAGLRYNGHVSTRLQTRMIAAGGEALALPIWSKRTGSRWMTCIQPVDPARLSNPNNSPDSNTLRGGIELSPDPGAPATAYHIRKTHPGDLFGLSGIPGGEWERVPAYHPWGRRRVIHIFESERVGQTRGKAVITSVARQFRMLDKMMTEQLRLAVLNSLIFAALETPLDQNSIMELMGGPVAGDPSQAFNSYQDAINEWRVQMRGGAIIPMPPGTSMKPFAPQQQMSGLESFTNVMLRSIGTGLNMPYELVFRDFSKTNYSSARASLLEAWRYFLTVRQFITDHWLTAVYDLWFEEAVQRGMIPDCTPDDYYQNQVAWTRCKWIFNGRGWVDPQREALAAQTRMSSGISTLADECGEQGRDWREQMEQRARENALAEELGLPKPHSEDARVKVAEIAAEAKTEAADERVSP